MLCNKQKVHAKIGIRHFELTSIYLSLTQCLRSEYIFVESHIT